MAFDSFFIAFAIAVIFLVMVVPIVQSHLFFAETIKKIKKLIRLNNFPEVKRLVANIPGHLKNKDNLLFVQYWLNLKQKNYHMAIYYLDEIQRRQAFDKDWNLTEFSVYGLKITVYEAMENIDEVIRMCYRFLEVNPKNLSICEKLATHLYEKRNFKEAEVFLKKAIDLKSKNWQIYRDFSKVLLDHEQYQEASDMIDYAIRFCDDKSCYLMEQKVQCLFFKGDFRTALDFAKKIDPIYKKSVETQIMLGICNHKSDLSFEAFNIFTATLDKCQTNNSPAVVQARSIYSDLLLKKKEFEKAIEQLTLIEKTGKADGRILEKKRIFVELADNESFKDVFFQGNAESMKKIIDQVVNWQTFLRDFYQKIDEKNVVLSMRSGLSSSEKLGLLVFWFYLDIYPPNIEQVTKRFKLIKKLFSQKKLFTLHFCSLFRPEAEVVKEMSTFPVRLKFIIADDFIHWLKTGEIPKEVFVSAKKP